MRCLTNSGFPDIPGGVYYHLVHGTIDAVIIAVIICCNSLIIFAILRHNAQRKTKGLPSNTSSASLRLVFSLATSDILVAFSTIYFLSFEYSCAVYADLGSRKTPCVARFVFFMVAAATSCYSLIALAIDRYVAIVHALRYREIMSNRVVNVVILLVWLLGAAHGFMLIFWNNWTPTTPCREFRIIPISFVSSLCVAVALATVAILGFLHWRVYREALASNCRNRSMSSGLSVQPPRAKAMNTKSARIMYLVLGCIIFLWTPVTAIVIARGQGLDSPSLNVAYGLSYSIYNLSYIVNTFIYSWRNKTIRMAILQVFQGSRKRTESWNSGQNSFVKIG